MSCGYARALPPNILTINYAGCSAGERTESGWHFEKVDNWVLLNKTNWTNWQSQIWRAKWPPQISAETLFKPGYLFMEDLQLVELNCIRAFWALHRWICNDVPLRSDLPTQWTHSLPCELMVQLPLSGSKFWLKVGSSICEVGIVRTHMYGFVNQFQALNFTEKL